MAEKENGKWRDRCGGNRIFKALCLAMVVGMAVSFGSVLVAAPPDPSGSDSRGAKGVAPSAHVRKGISRQIHLDGPGDTGAMSCEVFQVLDLGGDPIGYFMDVDSVVCTESQCRNVIVRIHFDPLGGYQRYELPSGGNLTKVGHKPFSLADHEKLHQILSDPYSQLKSVGLNEITVPKVSSRAGDAVDAISRPTVLSKQSSVVAGAAYTCCTLWHWSHGEVVGAIRDMTIRASDREDWIRHLQSGEDDYGVFALGQLETQELFDAGTVAAVVHALRHGSEKLTDPALDYLAKASSKTGVDSFFCCSADECLVTNSWKRVRFLEAVRDAAQDLPADYVGQFGGWLARADSYYEVHLLLSLLEREESPSEEAVREALLLLESDDSLVVRRSYRYLKSQQLNDSQQKELETFEREHPDR